MKSSGEIGIEVVRFIAPLVILGGAITAAAQLMRREPPQQREKQEDQAALVETAPVELHSQGLDIEVDGTVVPFRELDLAAEVAGRIVERSPSCRAGQYVRKGEVLFRIDPEFYSLEVQRLTQELEQAEINQQEVDIQSQNTSELIKLAEEQLTLQQKQLDRLNRLSATRSASASELDEEAKNELTSRNSLLTLSNELRLLAIRKSSLEMTKKLAQSRLQQARLDLDHTEIKAPFDGVISVEPMEAQEYVQKGTNLVTIQETKAAEVRCNLRMEELRWLWQQGPALQTVSDDSAAPSLELPKTRATIVYRVKGVEYTWDGVLDRYDGYGLDEKTRTVPCRVLVDNPRDVRVTGGSEQDSRGAPPTLMRGMFVTARIHVMPEAPLYRVPEVAVRPGNLVWRVKDGKLDIVPIDIARIIDDKALAPSSFEGLAPGDRMIVSPLSHAVEGMPVREAMIR